MTVLSDTLNEEASSLSLVDTASLRESFGEVMVIMVVGVEWLKEGLMGENGGFEGLMGKKVVGLKRIGGRCRYLIQNSSLGKR